MVRDLETLSHGKCLNELPMFIQENNVTFDSN